MPHNGKIRVIAFGAHPDDCEIRAGGTAAQFAALGHPVKFVSVTNGDAGHQAQGGGALGARRRAECVEAGRRLGIAESVALDHHDGELEPSLPIRREIIRLIRQWQADIVMAPRPNDYHPDHRYTGILVQDAAYMVMVPNVCPDTPPLKWNPVFLYFQDEFVKPAPFQPDIAVAIDEAWEKKVDSLDGHVSQFYEWLPWVDDLFRGAPEDPRERRQWLDERSRFFSVPTPAVRTALEHWYGAGRGRTVRFAEAFEVCEYGRRPDAAGLKRLFPMIP